MPQDNSEGGQVLLSTMYLGAPGMEFLYPSQQGPGDSGRAMTVPTTGTAWVTLSEADVVPAYISTDEVTKLRQLGGTGGTDPLAQLLADVSAEVRGAIQSNPRNRLDMAPTIPPSLKMTACILVMYRVLTRAGSGVALDKKDARKLAADKASETLLRVEEGKRTVEACLTGGASYGMNPSPSYSGRGMGPLGDQDGV